MAENTENTQVTNPVIGLDEVSQSINSAPIFQSNPGIPIATRDAPIFSSTNLPDLYTSKFTPMPLSQAYRDIGGNALTGPNNNVTGSSIADYLNNASFANDPKFAGVNDIYGAANEGLRFAKAYNHSAFDRLGFSPYVDNTSKYLGYASGWEDFKTAIAPNRLFAAGMVDQATNWFEWNKPTDPAAARLMTDTMELYQTQRTGFWGGAANTMASLQYSAGAITEFALEELAIIGATAASGGTAGAGGFLRTARNVGALGRSIRVGSELLNTIRTVDRAKDFWQAARFAGVGAGKTANALLNPLYRTTSNIYDTYKGVKAGKTTAELAKNKAMFGDFFRDMSEINMALSEARLEGGITQNEIYDGIIKANPNITQAQAENAYKLSVQGGGEDTMWNALTIYMTNKFVFDGLLGRMMPKASRLLAAGEKMGGKFVMDNGKRVFLQDGFGKNIRRALLPISKEGKLFYKHLVQTGPSRLSNFTLAGTMEGLQENTQEMLNIAYTDYYTSLYNTPELAQSKGLRASLTKGLHEQFTSQGLQTFLSGFAIGGTLNQYGKALNWSLYKAPMIIADKTGMDKSYSTTKQSREEFRKQMVDTVNDMDNDPGSYFNAMENDLAHQVNFYDYTVAAQQVGDVKTTKNSQDMQLLKRVHTMFRSGNTDLLKDTFSNFLQMSDEDLQAAFPSYKLAGDETNAPLRNRLEDVIKKVDVMENSFKESQKLENPYNPYNIDKAKEPKKFNDEATKYLAFEEVRFDMAFLKTNLVLAHQYVDNILSKASENKPISNISGAAFTSILTENGIKTELDMLQKERQAYEQTAATSDKAAAKLAEIDNSIKMHENYLAAYEIYKDAKQKQPVDSVTRKSEITTDPVTGLVINPVTQELESKAVDLNSAFGALINQMGSAVNERPLSENVDAVFDSLREMIDHGVDISASIDALNLLYNPAGFEAHHSRIKTAMDNVHAMYRETNTKTFDELQHKKDLNVFLQRLLKKGIFYDPKHNKAFEDDSILPDTFIDKDTMMELDHTSPKYKDLLSAIDEFEKSTGKTLSGKTIPQYEDTFGALRVTRDVNDVRTMSTLSKQYSVSEDLVESSVSAEEILKAIASSPQALATERLLAKRLATVINKATKVTFVRNLTVPVSYSELTGVLIDLRYASIDYAGGVLKAEPIILSGILRNIVATELSSNDTFKAKLQDLLNIAKKNIFKDGNSVSQLPIGLDSLESFAAEALSNYSFQAALKAIDYTGERSSTQSLWSEFRKALSDFFAKLFNIPVSTRQSLLDEVVDLTALNIDPKAATVGAEPTAGSSTNSKPPGIKITQATPFEDIMALSDYADVLRTNYNSIVIGQQQQDPSFAPTEESFKEWVLTSPLAANFIERMNLNTGRTMDDPANSQPGSTQNNGNSATMSGEIISEEDYRTFQQTQQVSDNILNEIKSRMEMGKALTPRQHEIFTLYGDVIREAISQQKAIDQTADNTDEIIKSEIARLTVPQIYGDAPSPFIGGGDGQFTLVFGGQVNAYQFPDGSYTAIVYQNITQEQVLAGDSPKGYPVSSILASTEASYAPLQDALRPIQQAVDAIVAKNTKPVEEPVTTTTNTTTQDELDAIIDQEIMTALAAVQDEEAFTGARELTPEEELQQEQIIADIRAKYIVQPITIEPTAKVEPEKTEEQQVDEEINGNPETRDEVQDGMSGIDNASTEVTSELDELERRSREGKTAPITERAKETLDQVRSSVTQILDSMKSSYAKMGPQMANGYEKLRRAHKKTAGKIREKIKDLLDKIMRFMRKLQTVVKATYEKVSKRPKSNLPSITNELPVVRPTGLEQVDTSVDQLSDYITSLLDTYGFTAFFNASGFTVDQDVIKNIDTLSTKFGDAKILGYASPMEIVTHKLVHAFIDKKVKGSEIEKFDKKAQVRINTLKTLLGEAIENGQTYGDILDNLNYVYDKSPAQQLAAYFLTNRRFRTIVSRLSKDAYRSLEILAKDMTGFTDARVAKFIALQDGLDMADDMYNNFEANSSKSPMTIVAEALETAGPENTIANIAEQLATPLEEIISEEATEEELQEIADSEKKSVPEIISDIKNTVIRYLTSVKFGKNKTPIDAAPRTKKEGIIRRIFNKMKKLVIAFGVATTMFAAEGAVYVGITGLDVSTNTEGEVSKPAWSVSNSIDNTLNYLPIPDAYKQTMMRGFVKYGLYDINNVKEDVDGTAVAAQAVKESEDRLQYIQENTYFDSLGVNKDGLGGPTDSLLKYRNQWFNDVGFEYLAAPSNSTRDRVGQMTFDNTVGVAHFYIMDDTGGDLSRYTSAQKIAEAREVFKKRVGTYDIKPTDYVPVFKYMPQNEQGENIVKLQYKIASELTNDDIAITKLLQWKYSEIDWASKHRLYNAANCLTTKAGNKAQSFTFSTKAVDDQGKPIDPKDLYSRFSGSTIVFIFKDPKGNTIVREFTGSINNIKREGENIMKDFKVEPEDLTVGAFDAGSYSGKPVSKKGVLDTNQWDGFNKIHPNAGSALVIPKSSTTKTIQLSDIQATNAQIDQVINEKTKACKL